MNYKSINELLMIYPSGTIIHIDNECAYEVVMKLLSDLDKLGYTWHTSGTKDKSLIGRRSIKKWAQGKFKCNNLNFRYTKTAYLYAYEEYSHTLKNDGNLYKVV